ncbi:hypothetical protein D1872_201890 [compost metagenome]
MDAISLIYITGIREFEVHELEHDVVTINVRCKLPSFTRPAPRLDSIKLATFILNVAFKINFFLIIFGCHRDHECYFIITIESPFSLNVISIN